MKKSFLLITLFFALLVGTAFNNAARAQSGGTDNKSSNFDPYWYLNLNFGRSLMYGDFMSTPVDLAKYGKQTGFNAGVYGGRQFTPVFGLRAQTFGGTLKARRDYLSQKEISHYLNLYIEPTIDFTNLFWNNPDRKFFAYVFGGAGFTNLWVNRTGFPSEYETGTGILDGMTFGTYTYGGGLKYNFNEIWGITGELSSFGGFKHNDADRLDGLIEGKDKDAPVVLSIGVNYNFVEAVNLKKMAENYGLIKYEVTPNPLEMHGDSVIVTVKGTVPEKYFEKKAAILINPELKYNGGTYALNPITLKGEEVNGPGVAIPYKTGGTFKFTQTIPYIKGMSASDLMANPIIYKPATGAVDPKATAVQIRITDKFVDIPAHKLADGVIITPLLILHDEDLLTAADKLVKEKFADKEAVIYFQKSKSDLDWKLDANKKNAAALADLNAFINQGWQIKNIDINGFASPDGEETFNQGLSSKRALTGKQYLVDMFKKMAADQNATDFQKNLGGVLITTAAHGEDWDGFMQSVQASDIKEKSNIVTVVNSQPDFDKRNKVIRSMTRVFKILAKDILPPLRRVNIKVNSYQPIRTDVQFLNDATTNPSTLTVEELLYSATLTKDSKVQLAIYKSTMSQNKDDWRAFNNAGAIELKNGNTNNAAADLKTANTLNPNNVIVLNNLGAVEAKKGNDKVALDYFKKAKGLGANETYNAGIPQIAKAKYADAVTALNVKKCNHNLGLAQLLAGNSQAAIVTLKCAPAAPDTYYLLAIAAARTNDNTLLYDNLAKAIKMNSSLKERAAGDREFIRFFNVPEFQALVK